jgi:2,4-dienoyl-CoA reductase (NADPH2)
MYICAYILVGCKYVEVNDDGLVIERKGTRTTLPVDTVVVCAGQEPLRDLYESFDSAKTNSDTQAFLIGGAQEAGRLRIQMCI